MKFRYILSFFALTIMTISCRRDGAEVATDVVKEWYVPFNATYANPAPAGHVDSGTVHITLLADNSLRYDFLIKNITSGDALTGITLNAGDPITNGPVLLDLKPRLGGQYVTGGVFNVRQGLVDSLLSDKDIYFNATSLQQTNSLFRGQLNSTITLAGNVTLSGANEVPAVTTTAKGTAIIRVTTGRKVYSIVTVTNLEAGDQLTMSHIHVGAPGQNGSIIVPLANSAADFGVAKTTTIDDATYNTIMTSPLYVNVHSTLNPNGKLRGQLK